MKCVLSGAVAVAAVMVLAPADAQDKPTMDKPEMPKLRLAVGGKSAIFYLPLSVTERLGYFKQAGLELEIADVQSGARALQSLVGGSAEMGVGTFDHTIQMQAKGQPVVAVAQYGRYPGFVLATVAAKSIPYRGPQNLKGLKIGVTSPGSSTHFMAAYMLVRSGSRPTMPRSSAPA
jgi:NitT/TauT family transport system substrate-binding protein